MSQHIYDMLIIGGGPGGYTAALYAARAGLDVLLLEKTAPGGQLGQTHQIDNYPGFPEGIDGFSLADNMRRQAERFGAKTLLTAVQSVDLVPQVKTVTTGKGVFRGRTVVLSTGAGPRPLGLPGEKELTGRGIGYCAACDGMFYRGKTVVVVGGGNTAASDALFLSRLAKEVIVVHRRDPLRATKVYHAPLMEAPNVSFLWNSAVTGLLGEEKLTAIRVKDLVSGQERQIAADGLFVAIGTDPATGLFAGQVALDDRGYVLAGESTETNLPGVYAVGDVRAKALRQVVTAVADGAAAAHHAEEYLSKGANP
jgi:thioredoxin reductase (NADPH)